MTLLGEQWQKHKDTVIIFLKVMTILTIVEWFSSYVAMPVLLQLLNSHTVAILDAGLTILLSAPLISFFIIYPLLQSKKSIHADLQKEVNKAVYNLQLSEERYMLASRGANDGLFDWDLVNQSIFFSQRWKDIIGYKEHELDDNPHEWISRIHIEDLPKFNSKIKSSGVNPNNLHHECEYRILKKDGNYIWVLTRWTTIFDKQNKPIRIVGSQSNIERRKAVELKLAYDASFDSLTGLANRNLLNDTLNNILQKLKSDDSNCFALLLIDIDDFKLINDSLGHLAGDDLLKRVADRFKSTCSAASIIARLGGDEFAIIIPCQHHSDSPIHAAISIISSLDDDIQINDMRVKTTVSIGIANITSDYQTTTEVIRDADIALYEAKGSTSQRYILFEVEMRNTQNKLFVLSQDLINSIKDKQIIVHYQPIVDASSGVTKGYEALLRWNHPKYNNVTPDYFIPIAEKSKFISDLFRYVLMSSCELIKKLDQENIRDLFISVNMSGFQLNCSDVVNDIKTSISYYNIRPEKIKIEITESVLIDFKSSISATLNKIKEFGVAIALDDFGTGYSSINALYQYPFDYIKIDKSLVKDINTDDNCKRLVASIHYIASSLNKDIVAEGVETQEQLACIQSLGIKLIQGYYFSKPIPENDVILSMRKSKTPTREGVV